MQSRRCRARRAWHLSDGDGFGQIAGLIHVEAAQHCQVVAQQLQRHNVDDGLQAVHYIRHLRTPKSSHGIFGFTHTRTSSVSAAECNCREHLNTSLVCRKMFSCSNMGLYQLHTASCPSPEVRSGTRIMFPDHRPDKRCPNLVSQNRKLHAGPCGNINGSSA